MFDFGMVGVYFQEVVLYVGVVEILCIVWIGVLFEVGVCFEFVVYEQNGCWCVLCYIGVLYQNVYDVYKIEIYLCCVESDKFVVVVIDLDCVSVIELCCYFEW